jgi:hypothetical protein
MALFSGRKAMPDENFASIITSVNTPLALAALSVLVIGSILFANAKGRERPELTRYGFGLSALFGVLAIGGFFYDSYNNRIFLAEGIVVNEDGRPVDGVFIDMGGAGRTVSGEDGRYKVPVFEKDAQASYSVSIRKPGYGAASKENIAGPHASFQQIALKQNTFAAKDITIDSDATLDVYIGAPQILINISLANNTISPRQIQSIILKIKAPNGRETTLYSFQIMDAFGQRPFTPISLPPLQEVSYPVSFNDFAVIQMAMATADSSGLMGPMGCMAGDGGDPYYQNPALEAQFDRTFIWNAGEWSARLSFVLTKGSISKTFRFSISQNDMDTLHRMKTSYKKCLGLMFANHYVSDGDMKSVATVNLASEE